jgi:tetratricopeptide (TPR) repeat protein
MQEQDYPFREDREELEELLKQYQNLKSGKSHSFLEEESFEKIIDYFDDSDDLQQAIEAVETGLEYFPYSSQLLIKKADLLLATRHYKEALDILDQAALFDNNDINLYILRTDAYLALDQQAKAVEILEEALHLFDGEERIDLLFELADVYDDYEEFDKVFDCLRLILEDQPTNEEALYKICFWTDFTGRNEESIKLHQKIIEDYPYNELAWFNLAASYQGLKLYEKAIDAYQFAVTIDDKFDYAYRNMGDAYIRLRKYKDAIDALEKVLELTRPEEVIYEAIGHCYHRMGKFAQARFNYRKASHMNPDDSKLHYKIALTYINEEQWESGIKQLELAMRINRNVPEYSLALGECLMQLERHKEAIQYLSTVVRNKPKSVAAREALIKCLFKATYFDEAADQCISALKATDGRPLFYFLYSACLFAAAKSKEALIQLENGLNAAPKMVKNFIEMNPSILQNSQVVDLLARFKRNRKF